MISRWKIHYILCWVLFLVSFFFMGALTGTIETPLAHILVGVLFVASTVWFGHFLFTYFPKFKKIEHNLPVSYTKRFYKVPITFPISTYDSGELTASIGTYGFIAIVGVRDTFPVYSNLCQTAMFIFTVWLALKLKNKGRST